MKRYGLVNIFKPSYGDSSNRGLSYRFTNVNIIEMEEGESLKEKLDGGLLEDNDVILKFEHGIYKAFDAKKEAEGKWLMFGGCFIYTSNGSVPIAHEQAIKLFDRCENNTDYGGN